MAILVHNPISLASVGGAAIVEDEGLSHSDYSVLRKHGFVSSRGLPKPGSSGSVGPRSGRVLLVLVTKEVPFVLFTVP